MFVADYMNADPPTIGERDTLATAQEKMASRQVLELPVVDESRRLVGIVTDRDVRSAVGYDRNLSEKLHVSEVMTAEPKTISLNATLDEALEVFCLNSFNGLPVMNGTQLAGIITRHDMLRAFHRVLGLDQEGGRVEIALPDMRHDLADAFAALKGHEASLLSAVVSPMRRDGDEPTLYLRVAGTDSRKVEELLSRAGLIVLVPEHG
jgi:acetoin utilization protein AcuB